MKIVSIESGKDINEFENIIKEMPALVKIYSPGCSHCIEMAPAWEKLKKNGELKDFNFALVAINASVASDMNIPGVKSFKGVPTIREIKKGSGEAGNEYIGNRSSEDMANFIKKTFSHTGGGNNIKRGGSCSCNQNGGALKRFRRRSHNKKSHKKSHKKHNKSHKKHKKTHRR